MKSSAPYWWLWVFSSVILSAWLSWHLLASTDKQLWMPGPLSDGHHQLKERCDVCHGDSFSREDVLQEACVSCHGEQRVKPFDSHPRSKFKDPRNADRLEKIDAMRCVTCHTEHRPEILETDGLTQPVDICFHCHEDIGEERASHSGMEFTTCKSSGCHNFHDNQALYTDFLINHLDEDMVNAEPVLPKRQFGLMLSELSDYPLKRYPQKSLNLDDADYPLDKLIDDNVLQDWLDSAHAKSGVNCSACHIPDNAAPDSVMSNQWLDQPPLTVCKTCHAIEMTGYENGRHGMRQSVDLEPMTVAQARISMHQSAQHLQVDCNSCHSSHRYDVQHAAAQACLDCHADQHSLAWKDSKHGQLWQQELAGEVSPGQGVSCASCHLPRMEQDISEWMSRIVVQHNQNAVLSPNSKMIRPACLHCHGLEMILDALADRQLINNNFKGLPSRHLQTMEMVRVEKQRRDQERVNSEENDTSMFGF